jgi:hypothetical protein
VQHRSGHVEDGAQARTGILREAVRDEIGERAIGQCAQRQLSRERGFT